MSSTTPVNDSIVFTKDTNSILVEPKIDEEGLVFRAFLTNTELKPQIESYFKQLSTEIR
jgi:uncharacterized membrane protein